MILFAPLPAITLLPAALPEAVVTGLAIFAGVALCVALIGAGLWALANSDDDDDFTGEGHL